MRRLQLWVIGTLGVAVLAGCGAGTTTLPATAAAPAATAQAAGVVPQALAFSAPRVGGGTLDLAAYAGKPVLLWFWAPT